MLETAETVRIDELLPLDVSTTFAEWNVVVGPFTANGETVAVSETVPAKLN